MLRVGGFSLSPMHRCGSMRLNFAQFFCRIFLLLLKETLVVGESVMSRISKSDPKYTDYMIPIINALKQLDGSGIRTQVKPGMW